MLIEVTANWLVNMVGRLQFLWLLAIISCICSANGRQIRISRYTTELSESGYADTATDESLEIEATVREIKLAPYPAAGYRPAKAFPLPTEHADDLSDSESVIAEQPESWALTTTTEGYASETTTAIGVVGEGDADVGVDVDVDVVKAPYPAAGFRPKIPFNLPGIEQTTATPLADFTTRVVEELTYLLNQPITTEMPLTPGDQDQTTLTTETPLAEFTPSTVEAVVIKAPYPAAGFKPRIPFHLPTYSLIKEQGQDQDATEAPTNTDMEMEVRTPYPPAGFRPSKAFPTPNAQLKQVEDEKTAKDDNSKHPACGSSTNPLAPKPIDGEKSDPDSETIFVSPQTVVVPMRLTAQPLMLTRPLVYTTHLHHHVI